MRYKILFIIFCLVCGLFSQASCQKTNARKDIAKSKYFDNYVTPHNYRELLQEMKSKDYDVSEAKELNSKAKLYMRRNQPTKARRYLKKAILYLQGLKEEQATGSLTLNETKDNKSKQIKITIDTSSVYVSEAIPSYNNTENGNLTEAVLSRKVQVKNGILSIDLSNVPVYIEKKAPNNNMEMSHPKDSPFGISSAGWGDLDRSKEISFENALDHIEESGADWIRFMSRFGGIPWGLVEKEKGKYYFSKLDNTYQLTEQYDFNILANIYPTNVVKYPNNKKVKGGYLHTVYPEDHIKGYLEFVERVVQRYKDRIDIWVFHTEPEIKSRWQDSPEKFAKLFIDTYKTIKDHDKKSTVCLGGVVYHTDLRLGRDNEFVNPMLKETKRLSKNIKDFDIAFALHHYRSEISKLINNLDKFYKVLEENGFDSSNVLVTDIGIKRRSGVYEKKSQIKDEAIELFKLYVVALAHGVDKLFWEKLFYTKPHRGNLICVGLLKKNSKIKMNDTKVRKKTTFYTYKLLSIKLQNLNLDKIKILKEGENGIYLYKFYKKDNSEIYIGWHN